MVITEHGAEPFNSLPFMEPKGTLPCSQRAATTPYPEPDEPSPPYIPMNHFNILFPFTLRSSK